MRTRSPEPHLSAQVLMALLENDIDMSLPTAATTHLDSCETCRKSLESLAGDPGWWDKARGYLAEEQGSEAGTGELSSSVVVGRRELDLEAARHLLEPPGHPEMLGRIDHFEIEEILGQGGMGIVFKGLDRELNRAVAVKFLAPHLAASGTARQRFAREARAAAAVVHPNVVPIHAIRGEKRPYLVMALIGGPSLQTWVEQHGPPEITEIVRIGMQIAAGLAAAHRQGLVHRDIKPSNILLDGEAGRALITDFGLARAADDASVTQSGWLAGTPHYMSPEQTRGEELDGRSDLFSLGSVLYFLATGREPFRAEQGLAVLRKIAHEEPLPPNQVQPRIPRPLARLIQRLLAKDPARRFSTAEELHAVLEQYLAHLQHPHAHKCPETLLVNNLSERTASRRRSAWIAGIVTLSSLILLLLGNVLGRSGFGTGADRLGNADNNLPKAMASGPLSNGRDAHPSGNSTSADDSEEIIPWEIYQRESLALAGELQRFEILANTPSPIDEREEIPAPLHALIQELEFWEAAAVQDELPRSPSIPAQPHSK